MCHLKGWPVSGPCQLARMPGWAVPSDRVHGVEMRTDELTTKPQIITPQRKNDGPGTFLLKLYSPSTLRNRHRQCRQCHQFLHTRTMVWTQTPAHKAGVRLLLAGQRPRQPTPQLAPGQPAGLDALPAGRGGRHGAGHPFHRTPIPAQGPPPAEFGAL